MKNDYVVRAMAFIDKIADYTGLDNFEYEGSHRFQSAVHQFLRTHPSRVIHEKGGATRIVFITSDYVIKVNRSESRMKTQYGDCRSEVEAYERVRKTSYGIYFAPSTLYRGCEIQPRINRTINKKMLDWDEVLPADAVHYIYRNFFDLHFGNFTIRKGNLVCFFDYAATHF